MKRRSANRKPFIYWVLAVAFASGLIAVLVLGPAFYAASAISGPDYWPNRRSHFMAMRSGYDKAVHTLPGHGPHLKLFVWEMDPIGGTGVVYDASDEIALPKKRRPKNWAHREATYPGALEELCRIDSVGSHYYIVSFGCYGDGI